MLNIENVINNPTDKSIDKTRRDLLGDLYYFFFYAFFSMRGILPEMPQPIGRVTHFRTMADALMRALRGELHVLPISVPPRYGKTKMACAGVAWCYAHQPAANFIYASHSKVLAAEQTEYIRQIIQSKFFKTFFDARISKSIGAKDNFMTEQGGHTIAVGADGTGVGRGAGMTGNVAYGGALIMDDVLKPEEVFSKAATDRVVRVYTQTFMNRRNSPETTPIILLAQRTGQNDLTARVLDGIDGEPIDVYQKEWRENAVIIRALDDAGNALWPDKHSKEYLENLKIVDEYTFYSQMQQEPISSSNRIFKVEYIKLLKEEPKMLETIITVDTAETADEVNDATAFSMWGVYHIEFAGQKTGMVGLHSIACKEIRVEPQDLEEEFELFYGTSLRHKVKPRRVFIEKKSTGSALIGFMKNKPGLIVVDIERPRGNGSKTHRFKEAATFMAKGYVSIMRDAYHLDMFMKHMNAITFGATQRNDDIADTFSDAARLVFIDKSIYNDPDSAPNSQAVDKISSLNRQNRLSYARFTGGMRR